MTAKLLIAIVTSALLLTFCTGCANREPKPLDITGMTKDQVRVEVARIALEENKVAARREENKAWWQGVARSAGTFAVQLSASWFKAKFIDADDNGFRK